MTETIALNPKNKNLTNQRFGSLLALRPIGQSAKRHIIWEFKCDCGSLYKAEGYWITRQSKIASNPKAPSCGCLNKETTRELRLTHGMSAHPLFWVWVAMLERCRNPKNPSYHKYGAKGVYVCAEWENSSSAFLQWALANGWEKGLHLDKDILSHQLNLPTHYSPQTCQFINPSVNCRSTKKWLSTH